MKKYMIVITEVDYLSKPVNRVDNRTFDNKEEAERAADVRRKQPLDPRTERRYVSVREYA